MHLWQISTTFVGTIRGKSVPTSLQSGKSLVSGGGDCSSNEGWPTAATPNSIHPQSRRANHANANRAVIGKTKRTNTRGGPIKAAVTDLGDNRTLLRRLRLAAPPLQASNSPAMIDCLHLRCETDRKSHALVITRPTWLIPHPALLESPCADFTDLGNGDLKFSVFLASPHNQHPFGGWGGVMSTPRGSRWEPSQTQ